MPRFSRSQAKVGPACHIKDYGVFAKLANKPVKGLDISELSHEHVESTSQAVTVGEEYEVRIIHLTMERRQVDLSIK